MFINPLLLSDLLRDCIVGGRGGSPAAHYQLNVSGAIALSFVHQ